MNSQPQCSPRDLFDSQTAVGAVPIVIEVRGIEVQFTKEGKQRTLKGVPSFKTGKTAFGWMDKLTRKIMARPVTLPEHRKWMDRATLVIESRLRSIFQITDAKISTVAQPRSWIASLMPLDDSWRWCPEIEIKADPRLCEPGREGATIKIIRLT